MSMPFSVHRSSQGLVRPVEATPSGTLPLSAIDRLPVLRCNARTLHVYRQGPEAAQLIKEALSKALVPYYPLAGRLQESAQGHLQIDCCGLGVLFVEATATCSLPSVNYFDNDASIPFQKLLPVSVPREMDGGEPLVQMQVTTFAGGGFVIGLIFCHSICDGLGAAQFLNAVGELARGVENPSITPAWSREFFPSPPRQPMPMLPPPTPNYSLEHANFDISMDQIKQLKTDFSDSTGKFCSTFEAVAATFWRNRTLAVKFKPNTEVKLVFFANCRNLVNPPLPQGFYGNCFFPVTITASSELLEQASTVDAIKLIQEAKAKLRIEFEKYMKGEKWGNGEDPFAPPLVYSTLFISEWGRLGFNEVDYGWGPPMHVVPIQGSSIIPVGIVGSLPLPEKGVRLMTWCVEETHRQPFIHHMMQPI